MPDIFTRQKRTKTTPSPVLEPETEKNYIDRNPLSMITTFCHKPSNVKLMGQDHDEEIIFFLRADFITNVPWIIISILCALFPLIFPFLLNLANINLDFLPLRFNLSIAAFYYFLVIGYAFANYLTWFYTIGIVTNKKAVDIDFHDLSSIHVGTVNLVDTADAKYIQRGFFQSFFDYGDIIITVEATKEQFVFERTPRPAEITDKLGDLIGER